MSHQKLTRNIFIALLLGSGAGLYLPQIAPYVSWLGLAFKLSLGMVVMPIIFTSILGGMAVIGDAQRLSRLGSQTFAYFALSTFAAIIVGIFLVWIIRPGEMPISDAIRTSLSATAPISADEAPTLFVDAIKTGSVTPLSSAEEQDLLLILQKHAKEGSSIDELREYAGKLTGSLKIRAQLSDDTKKNVVNVMSWRQFFENQIKTILVNPFEALAKKDVLATIFFAILLGIALQRLGPSGKIVFQLNETINNALVHVIHWIMRFAPFGVFGLLVDVIAQTGADVFRMLGMYALCVVIGLFITLFVLYPTYLYFLSNVHPIQFFKAMRPAIAVAFSTSSSNATLPLNIQCVEEGLGINPSIARFVLPLGATVNMNGTALYEAVAAMFIAQLYGMSLGLQSQLVIALTAALAAIGAAGIPAAGTMTMALVLHAAGLPVEGVGLVLAIDRPLDMCRTVVNVIGDGVGSAILQKYNPDLPQELAEAEGLQSA